MTEPARKFYRTTVSIDVLSEDKPIEGDLADIAWFINEGDGVGGAVSFTFTELTDEQAAEALYEFGSEPGFFGLTDDGSEDEQIW